MNLFNPQIIVEVLSPTSEVFDRGDKFNRYRLSESLTDYVVVSPERTYVEHQAKQDDGSWRWVEYTRPEQFLMLAGTDRVSPLAEIYERVTFPPPVSVPRLFAALRPI